MRAIDRKRIIRKIGELEPKYLAQVDVEISQMLKPPEIDDQRCDRIIRRLIPVGVSYKSDPEEVIEILLKVAKGHPRVLAYPEPIVFFTEFGDSSINFELAVWLDNPMIPKFITSELNQAIWKTFAENNIEIPFPQRDLHIRSGIPWEHLNQGK